ncbi:Di-copper centre-containing protein [Zopfia rhizophila CBS 207.26]|uniref:tyrosinase n=1 Tax=Zopfia rhizophila CBS 207.26 TaxID=1314779 RepID=A0A6A6DV68_9PEZI|nr:Di-copper centre-containing protein [Zopfia rhizophila CBS 207.26]
MRSTHFVAASLLSTLAHGSPLKSVVSELVEKRQGPGSYYAITGATGGVHPRLEVRELEKTGEMWNLYLLAMRDFQAMDQNVIDSWYQIAGIHGMPWIEWDGVTGNTEGRDSGTMGYCPHVSPIFATWHRPYLALFEQKLQQIATGIAVKFPTSTRAKYQEAATKLRIPFWDWAKAVPTNQPVLPTALSVEKANVNFPDGTSGQIDNPLYDYNFHPLDNTQINGTGCPPNSGLGGSPAVCNNFDHTIRASESINNNAELDKRIRGILDSQRKTLYKILSQYSTFDQFSSSSSCAPGGVGSLESLHGPIHTKNYPGHMSPTAVTAFDPMFWFHHANVDRQLALYQAVFPDTYMGSCEADTPTFTVERRELLTANSGLTPFHKNKAGDFWTSADARRIQDMGYTYPELVGNPSNATIVASIKAQYSGPPDVPVTSAKAKTRRQDAAPTKKKLYLAEVNIPLYGLDDGQGGASPYNVAVFVGEVGSNAKEWTYSEEFVGIVTTLGGVGIQDDLSTTETVDLSDALKKAIDSKATSEDKAVEYLKENLHYRLELGDVTISREKVQGLKVNLISTEVEVAQSDDVFDRWVGGFKRHGEVDV